MLFQERSGYYKCSNGCPRQLNSAKKVFAFLASSFSCKLLFKRFKFQYYLDSVCNLFLIYYSFGRINICITTVIIKL